MAYDIIDIAYRGSHPEHANDLNEHNTADWPVVVAALKAAQPQLKIFAEENLALGEAFQEEKGPAEGTAVEVLDMSPIALIPLGASTTTFPAMIRLPLHSEGLR